MPHQVTVNRDNTVLPDGRVYNDGDTPILEDAHYRMIAPALLGADPLPVTYGSEIAILTAT